MRTAELSAPGGGRWPCCPRLLPPSSGSEGPPQRGAGLESLKLSGQGDWHDVKQKAEEAAALRPGLKSSSSERQWRDRQRCEGGAWK